MEESQLMHLESIDALRYKLTTKEDLSELLTFSYEVKAYNYAIGRWVKDTESAKISTEDSEAYYIHKGFGVYILKYLNPYLDQESKDILISDLTSDLPTNFDYSGLRDEQKSSLSDLIEMSRGLMIIPTGSGKTEIISKLVINMYKRGMKILLLAGGSKAKDELRNRINLRCPEVYIPNYFDEDAQVNLLDPNGFCRSSIYDNSSSEFYDSIDAVVADEVEATTSNSYWELFRQLTNCKYYYGFSATADKKLGNSLDIHNGLKCLTSMSAKWVVDIFGHSAVYTKPKDFRITIHKVTSIGLRAIDIDIDDSSESNVYRVITSAIFSHKEYLRALDDILSRVNSLYIPINNLEFIDAMYNRYSSRGLHVVTITGEGYYSSVEGWIDLDILKDLASDGKINLLLSTKAGFRALDFRGIPNILLTLGTLAGDVLQYVGRVARQSQFHVWYITPGGRFKIPILSKTNENQISMLENYYSECRLDYENIIVE